MIVRGHAVAQRMVAIGHSAEHRVAMGQSVQRMVAIGQSAQRRVAIGQSALVHAGERGVAGEPGARRLCAVGAFEDDLLTRASERCASSTAK